MSAATTEPTPIAPPQQGAELPIAEITPSLSNPRKRVDQRKIEELAESLKTVGQIQPIVVRLLAKPLKGKHGAMVYYEIIAGERRYRAAKLAGFLTILALVREIDDHTVLKLQVVENGQREDPHPLEEAEGYQVLHDKYGDSVEDIAREIQKPKAHVYARMKLCALHGKAREAFLDDKFNHSIALLIARVPGEKLQARLTKEILNYRGGVMSYREALEHVQRLYMLKLAEAPFDLKSADLVSSAGDCTSCPKRSGNDKELYADVSSADVCTDPTCYQEKVQADFSLRAGEAKTAGRQVLGKKEAAKIFPSQWNEDPSDDSGLVRLDHKTYYDPKNRSYRQILGKGVPTDKIVLAQHPHTGKTVELLPKAVLESALRAGGKSLKPKHEPSASEKKWKQEAQQQRQTEEVAEAVADRAVVALNAKLDEVAELPAAFWVAVASAVCGRRYDDPGGLNTRNGIPRDGYTDDGTGEDDGAGEDDAKFALYKKLPPAKLRAMLLEHTLRGLVREATPPEISYLCEALGVDVEKIEGDILNVRPPAHLVKACLDIPCPHCMREAGKKCHNWKGTQRAPHPERIAAAEKVAATPAPASPEIDAEFATPGTCRVCRCSQDDACGLTGEGTETGCAWADESMMLCTSCVQFDGSEGRDDTWRRLVEVQHIGVQRIVNRWGVTLEEVDAVLYPEVRRTHANGRRKGKAEASA